MGTGLGAIDLIVIVALMAGVTWIGHRLSGGIASRRSFFQADGSLPWWAVSASIIATLVSSVTFVSVPAAVFRDGGNLTYFQVILGLAAGKFFIAWLVSKPYVESRGIDSTYQYIGARMDARTGECSMWIGLGLNVINSAIKLLTASIVLDVITGWGLPGCALFVVGVSLVWSMLAGIKTVIWTDFLLFLLFTAGAAFALVFMSLQLDSSLAQALAWLDGEAKLILFDFSADPTVHYTLWAAITGSIGLSIALASTQGTWQRMRACRSLGDARRAYCWSAAFYAMHLIILGVGLALAVFYHETGLPDAIATQLVSEPDRIFPYFIVTEIPVGVSGLFIAAIFAAAISTLDSALTESADLTVTHIYERIVPGRSESHYLRASRASLVLWGLIFFGVSMFFSRYSADGLLNLTFELPNYLYGAIFGTIVLARFGIGRFGPFLAGVAVACATVAVLAQSGIAFFLWCPISGGLMIATVWALDRRAPDRDGVVLQPASG